MNDRGLYIMVLELKEGLRIKPGKLPRTEFKAGIYLYVGRARRGLKKRLERHLTKEKRLFWHIDYFLQKAGVKDVWVKPDSFDECRVVSQIRKFLKNSVIPQKKFGASDCHCRGHLLYFPDVGDLKILREKLAFDKIEGRKD